VTRLVRSALGAAIVLFVAADLSAQVGYDPRQSPYRDLQQTQELSLFTGFYRAKTDPAKVAPRSGPMVGAHYQWRISGPANLTFDVARVASERRVLDPERPACPAGTPGDCKLIGMRRWPLYIADAGLALSLTGARSFFRIVPEVKFGGGLATDFHTRPDVGDFAFGTRFAFTWGAGIRWVPGGRYQLRADVTNYLYSVRYPEMYYLEANDGSTILSARRSRTAWLNNAGLKFGMSYLFSR
jgi:hypothetical protein